MAMPSSEDIKSDLRQELSDLTRSLAASRDAVRHAFQNLAKGGSATSLEADAGTNTNTVSKPLPIRREVGLTSLFDDLKSAGLDPETEVLEYKTQLAGPHMSAFFNGGDEEEIVHIKRLRYSRGFPLAILTNMLLASSAPTSASLTDSGLYKQLEAQGFKPVSGSQYVGARRATLEEAELLQIAEGAAVITVERTVYAENDELISIEEGIYDASQYLLTFSLPTE
ncbi:MAG: GntR family transcriptional regulator [Ancrocorticia sp.]